MEKGKSDKVLIAVVGPSAVGKTAIGVSLANHFSTEIVSADARQCYREMAIGTAKPSKEELHAIPHHFIDTYSIHEELSAGKFEMEALEVINRIHRKSRYCFLVGGSGMYVQAVCHGFDAMPEVDPPIREVLNQKYLEHGLPPLLKQLKTIDPEYYRQVHRENPQRVIRALEVFLSSGKPYSTYRNAASDPRPFKVFKIGLEMDRDQLYQRIDDRVEVMVKQGLFEEARSLLQYRDTNALKTVGYKEIFDFLEGRYDYEETIRLIKRNTRRYAKRQLTWFKKDSEISWFSYDAIDEMISFIEAGSG